MKSLKGMISLTSWTPPSLVFGRSSTPARRSAAERHGVVSHPPQRRAETWSCSVFRAAQTAVLSPAANTRHSAVFNLWIWAWRLTDLSSSGGGGGVSMGNLVSIDWSWLTLVKTYWCSLLSKSITSPRYFNLQPKCLWQFLTPSWTRGKNSFDLCHFHKSRTTDRLQIISLYKRCFLHVVPKSELRSWEQKWASNLSRTGRKRSTAWGLVK